MAKTDNYTIDYQSLVLGEHSISIDYDSDLFKDLTDEVKNGQGNIIMLLTKHHNFAELNINISGTITVPCDRCLDPIEIPVDWQSEGIIKVTDMQTDNDDPDIIYISPNETTINLRQYLYECVMLSLPIQRTHQDIKLCNPDITKHIQQN